MFLIVIDTRIILQKNENTYYKSINLHQPCAIN